MASTGESVSLPAWMPPTLQLVAATELHTARADLADTVDKLQAATTAAEQESARLREDFDKYKARARMAMSKKKVRSVVLGAAWAANSQS